MQPIFVLEGILSGEECRAMIAKATARGFDATAVDYPPSYRDNDRLVLDDPALAAELFARVRSSLPSELDGMRLVGLNERFRFCRYHDGQSFRIHQDGAHAPRPGVRSRLTLQIYLDEGFTGGTTRFYESRLGARTREIVPRTGAAAVFDHALWHDGEPVTSGTKHVMRTDVIYEHVDVPAATEHEGYVFVVTALADGSLVSGSRDRTIRRWVDGRCTHVLRGHDASVLALAELAPGVIASSSRDRTVRVFDLATGTHRTIATLGGAVLSLAVVGDGLLACGAADGRITLVDREGVCAGELAGHTGWVWSLARTSARRLVSGSDDGTVRLWDIPTGACIASAKPERGACHAVAVLPGGSVACGFADGHIIVYDEALRPLSVIAAHEGEVYALASLGDGTLASGGEDAMVRIGDSAVPVGGFARSICRVPGRDAIAVASYDGSIRIIETAK